MPPQYWLYGLAPLNHLYTLARISCWPPEDGSICDPKHVGVNFTWTFNVFLINIELWVHELVIIETGHIDARFKHEGRKGRLKEWPLRTLMHAPNIFPEEMNIEKNPPRAYKIFRTTFESIISWRWSAGPYHPDFQ